jgi:beta-mannosidase
MEIKSLNGFWKFLPDPKNKLHFDKAQKKLLNTSLPSMKIPSNWQLQGLNNFSGSVWFVRDFKVPKSEVELFIIEFNGVDYFTDVWLNDKYLGHHQGYFQKFFFDATNAIDIHGKNYLIIKVNSPKEEFKTVWPLKKKLIKGIFNHHDCRPGGWSYKHGQDMNTGGIWKDVNLLSLKNIYVNSVRLTSTLNEDLSKATIKISIDYYSNLDKLISDKVEVTINGPDKKVIEKNFDIKLKKQNGTIELSLIVDKPKLWWTWDLGEQNIYTVSISGREFPLCQETFGIREVSLNKKQNFYLNRKKLFLRGTNVIPTQFLSDLTKQKIEEQVRWIKEANVNIIRMHAHVNRKEYYDECDKNGLLVWQDFALQWTYDESPEFNTEAVAQIKDMVKQHFNHPSIVFWCCHNEPGMQINSLDPLLYKAVLSIDKSRIVRLASNYEEHPYDGWYWGNKEHFAARPMGPLVTEFGAQALPEFSSLGKFLSKKEIEKPDWQKWEYHNFQYEQTFHIAEIDKGTNVKEFIKNSQRYQAELIQTAVDNYRRGKHDNVTGIFQFMFIDCWASITWSVIDYYGKKKAGYFALQRAFQPLYVSVKLRQRKYFPGAKLNLDLWAINDLYEEFKNCKIDFVIKNKMLKSLPLPAIEENSIKCIQWDTVEIKLPEKIQTGNHYVSVQLTNKSGKILSINRFAIQIVKHL